MVLALGAVLVVLRKHRLLSFGCGSCLPDFYTAKPRLLSGTLPPSPNRKCQLFRPIHGWRKWVSLRLNRLTRLTAEGVPVCAEIGAGRVSPPFRCNPPNPSKPQCQTVFPPFPSDSRRCSGLKGGSIHFQTPMSKPSTHSHGNSDFSFILRLLPSWLHRRQSEMVREERVELSTFGSGGCWCPERFKDFWQD